YEVGRYISLEQAIERTKESYYDTLYLSSQGWHESEHTLLPWWDYFLGVVLAAYRDFERRVGTISSARGAKQKAAIAAIARLPQQFQIKDLERACPGVSRPTLNRVLADMRRSGKIQCVKAGRDAVWEKLES
ncbi:MAG: cell filamentation protein Fic, partial [Cyanobacteria bacterium J06648_11]